MEKRTKINSFVMDPTGVQLSDVISLRAKGVGYMGANRLLFETDNKPIATLVFIDDGEGNVIDVILSKFDDYPDTEKKYVVTQTTDTKPYKTERVNEGLLTYKEAKKFCKDKGIKIYTDTILPIDLYEERHGNE